MSSGLFRPEASTWTQRPDSQLPLQHAPPQDTLPAAQPPAAPALPPAPAAPGAPDTGEPLEETTPPQATSSTPTAIQAIRRTIGSLLSAWIDDSVPRPRPLPTHPTPGATDWTGAGRRILKRRDPRHWRQCRARRYGQHMPLPATPHCAPPAPGVRAACSVHILGARCRRKSSRRADHRAGA